MVRQRKRAGFPLSEKSVSDQCPGAPGETEDDYVLVAKYEPDEEIEVRVLMMILGYPESEIERVITNIRLDSCD